VSSSGVLRGEQSARLLAALDKAAVVTAPGLFVAEVANALWKYHRNGNLSLDDAVVRYEEAMALVDQVTPDGEIVTEAIAEACRRNHPVYDLLYAVLARRHGAAVLTLDARLNGLLTQMGIPVAGSMPG
jgi:predicted nucleic acid-binding protein